MNTNHENFRDIADFAEARHRLGELINLGEPASDAVTRRAMNDERFVFYLMMTKDSPELLRQILDDPRTATYDRPDVPVAEKGLEETRTASDHDKMPPAPAHSTAELIGRAGASLLKWSKAGFKAADEGTIQRRWAACRACEFLVDPPQTLLYQGVKLIAGKDVKVCAACGCAANKKIALPSESCPRPHADNPQLTRWGESRPASERRKSQERD
jgi:hypothetical protein